MDIEHDFSDVDSFFKEGYTELDSIMDSVGQEAVDYAKENGSYQDRTGELRKSNIAKVDKGLVLENSQEYASYVEAKGFEVLSGAALYAHKRLEEEVE